MSLTFLLCMCISFSLKEFLPKEYIKHRGAEKTIFQVDHFTLSGLFHYV